jgi:hypothetical protein
MFAGKIVFAPLVDHLPMHGLRRCVERGRGHYKVQSLSCLDQYLCMAFAQLTYRESRRDIEATFKDERRRLRTVMQELMNLAARLIETGRRLKLRFARHCPAFRAFDQVYHHLAFG